ncbi:hypothetical protein EB118_15050 [bacterium]|nr:hypothetical protein [bacterium]
MKKNLHVSRIPNDIKYRLGLVGNRLEDISILLASLDPACWPGGEMANLVSTLARCTEAYNATQDSRPRKRTEVTGSPAEDAPVEPVQAADVDAPSDGPVDFPTLDSVIEAAPVEAPVEPVQVAEEVPVDRLALIKSAASRTRRSKKAVEVAPETAAAE